MKAPFLLLLVFISCTAALLGDDQFGQAMESMMLSAREDIVATLTETGAPFVRMQDCLYNADNFKLPDIEDIDVGSILGIVLRKKVLKIGQVENDFMTDTFMTFIDKALVKLGKRYSVDGIQKVVTTAKSNDELISGLLAGKFDITAPGFFSNGFETKFRRLRELRPMCSPASLEFNFYVRKDENNAPEYSTVDILMDTARNTQKKIIVFNSEAETFIKRTYGDSVLMKRLDTQSLSLLTESSEYLAAFVSVLKSSEKLDSSNVTMIKSNFVLPVLTYTREERKRNILPLGEEAVEFHSGNSQLRSIIDSAVWNIQVENVKDNIASVTDTVNVGDCVSNVPAQPKEAISIGVMKGTLLQVVKQGQIKVGYVAANNPPLISVSKGNVPTGLIFNIEQAVINKLKDFVGTSLTIVPVVYDSPNDLFKALSTGKIDVTSASMLAGASVGGVPRKWQFEYSCSPIGWQATMFAKTKYTTYSDLVEAAKNGAKFYVESEAMRDVARDLFGKEIVTKVVTATDAFAGLVSESEDYAAFLPEFVAEGEHPDVSTIKTGNYLNGVFFFRKDSVVAETSYDNNEDNTEDITHLKTGTSIVLGFFVVLLCMALACMVAYAGYNFWQKRKEKTAHIRTGGYHAIDDGVLGDDIHQDDHKAIGDDKDPDYVAPQFK
eukprot:TRINITY_DN874_c0_g1_i2.p1 TRINITY_DN874_c0_g1~~TRINITY_DN874_c0_g1_i2.p1  ORF type:complete len:674 (-),score=183.73 TRINITY_DN874_c0_g1_i2:70-2061(-)